MLVTLALATSHGTLGHAPAPVHQSVVTTSRPHRSSRLSTGTLAQQIENGGPYDVFMAADASYVDGLKTIIGYSIPPRVVFGPATLIAVE